MLNFDEKNVASLTCVCCKKVTRMTVEEEIDRKRLDTIFDFVMASLRTQGFRDGFICADCEADKGLSTKQIRAWCKRNFTRDYFESMKNVKVIRR